MRHPLAFALISGILAACSGPQPASPSAASGDLRAQVIFFLDSAAAAWTAGNLDRFVADYGPDSTTTFVGSKGILRGRDAIKAAYAPRFADGKIPDALSFQLVDVDSLAPDVAHIIAYYRLTRGDSITARGPTSLVLRRIDGRWIIVHDHSS